MRVSRSCLLSAFIAVVFSGGCDDTNGPEAPGSIRVVVVVSGQDIFLQGLRVNIANGPIRQLDSGDLDVLIGGLAPGAYTVRLEGMAVNCQISSGNPRVVTVLSNTATVAPFLMSCGARVGSVRFTTSTTGSEVDPDGYTATVIGGPSGAVPVNGTATIANVREGVRSVTLRGVSPNCAIAGPDTIDATVIYGSSADVAFSVQCQPAGRLEVRVATGGTSLDPTGYVVAINAPSLGLTQRLPVAPNGSAIFSQLIPAPDYIVTLEDVAVNCAFVGSRVDTVSVVAGVTASAAFDLTCAPPSPIALAKDGDIYSIASNGTDLTRLTTDPTLDEHPAWSSTGRIAFTAHRHANDPELYVMNADGTNQTRLTTSAGADDSPSWSPDGQRIVFRSFRDVNSEIYVVNANGSGLTRLTNEPADDVQPAWSSTGKIAFISFRDLPSGEIYVMNADGSNVVRLTHNTVAEVSPAWSPDGSMIAFARPIDCYYYCQQDLFVINADGSNERRLETGNIAYAFNADPSWAPNGQAIAFTQQSCPYYCDPPGVWIVDVRGAVPTLIQANAADPAWRP